MEVSLMTVVEITRVRSVLGVYRMLLMEPLTANCSPSFQERWLVSQMTVISVSNADTETVLCLMR